jgi:N-formylmaleamate deformylase
MLKFIASFLLFGASLASADTSMFRVQVSGYGQPMILIPGLASSGEIWNSTVDRYARTYECHVLTLAGFAV